MYVVAKLKEEQKKTRRRKAAASLDHRPDESNANSEPKSAWEPSGWLCQSLPLAIDDAQDPLSAHSDWLGPAKLVGIDGTARRVTEVFVSRESFGDQVYEEASRRQCESLLKELSRVCTAVLEPLPDWVAPETEDLMRWLTIGGFQPAIDEANNIRMMLKVRGRDGQVQLQRTAERLRFTMKIGTWSNLAPESEQGMLRLARQANANGRLARVAWIIDGNKRRCEGQVDLTGLPTAGSAERIWPDTMCMSMHGLELLLRRLSIELEVLANSANIAVAEQFLDTRPEVADAVSAAIS